MMLPVHDAYFMMRHDTKGQMTYRIVHPASAAAL